MLLSLLVSFVFLFFLGADSLLVFSLHTSDSGHLLPPILVSLGFSFFFSGLESAFLTSSKLHIELQHKQGRWTGQILSIFVKKPSQFLSTMLIGNTIALVFYGYYTALWMDPQLSQLPLLGEYPALQLVLQSVLSAMLVLFVAEFTPKNLFMVKPNFFLSLFAIPALVVYYVLFPVVRIVVLIAHGIIVKLFRLPYTEERPIFRLSDLGEYIVHLAEEGEGSRKETEVDARIFHNALDFKRVKVRECMVPRPEIVAVDEAEGTDALKEAFLKYGHSRIFLYKGSIDRITGYYHVLSLLHKPNAESDNPPEILPTLITTETNTANELLIQMLKENKGVALVVDEYGGTAGIVTLEDIIEEIFGEINDEHDQNYLFSKKLNTNTYLFSARLEIDYLNEEYNLKLPTGDYDTLGGLVISVSEELPKEGEKVQVGPYLLQIRSKEEHRIDKIELRIVEDS